MSLSWVLLTLAACRTPTETEALACPNRIDYLPLSGCADISARLLGAREQPLSGPYRIQTRNPFESRIISPDPDGYASLRLLASAADWPISAPATSPVWLIYFKYPDGIGVPPRYMDSTLVQVVYARPGQIPTPAQITLHLPVP